MIGGWLLRKVKKIERGVGVVTQWVKLQLATPASYIRAPVLSPGYFAYNPDPC